MTEGGAAVAVRTIILGAKGQHECVVDEEDYAFLVKWKWSFKVSSWKYGRKIYARRKTTNGSRYAFRTVMMHDVILLERLKRRRPSELHTGHHIDGNSLNNTRDNLIWGSKSTQTKRQKRRLSHAERRQIDEQKATP